MIFNDKMLKEALSSEGMQGLKKDLLENVTKDYRDLPKYLKSKKETRCIAMRGIIKQQVILMMSSVFAVILEKYDRVTFETVIEAMIGATAVACEVYEEEMIRFK